LRKFTPPPHKHNITTSKFTEFFNTIKNNFIVGGDFNAKHQSCGCRTGNPRGNTLHSFINQKKIQSTFPSRSYVLAIFSQKKKPDVLDIFVTKLPNSLYSNTANILDLNSDHSSVLLSLNASPPIQQTSPNLFNRFTDRLKFHDNVNENIKLNIKLKTPDDIDFAVKDLTNIIWTAAWSTTNKNSTTPHISNPLPEIIRKMITEKRRARASYQRTRLPSHKKL